MKKILFFITLLISIGCSFAYENQGFTSYKELDGNIEFQCDSQCFVLVGDSALGDYIDISGSLEGNGVIGYGFLQGQQIIPGSSTQINQFINLNQKLNFSDSPYRNQLPKNVDTKIMLVIQGSIKGKLNPQLGEMGVLDSISKSWKSFWHKETMTPYSINLRYGVKIGGKSIVGMGYFVFFIFFLLIIVFGNGDRKKKYNNIFYLAIGIFLFIGLRNLLTYSWIVNQGLTNYTNQSEDNKSFFDLGDYITFTDKVRKNLNLDTEKEKKCSIYVDSIQDWPFKAHRQSLYLKPCEVVLTGAQADYIVYFKKSINPEFQSGKILIDFNGSYLLLNK